MKKSDLFCFYLRIFSSKIVLCLILVILFGEVKAQDTKIIFPKIIGEWVHIYQPAGDTFPGPDSERFEAGKYYPDWQVNDHFIIKGPDKKWHAFGITHPTVEYNMPNPHEAEWQLFHAVAPVGKFKNYLIPGSWKDYTKVLPVSERSGEVNSIHAPHIVFKEGVYYMIYGHSPIRYATSKDLWTWEPKGVLFNEKSGARDPFILYYNGLYYMYLTSRQSIIVRTSENLLTWSDSKTVFSLKEGEKGGAESPQILFLKGEFYLIYCRWDPSIEQRYQDKSYVFCSSSPTDFNNREPIAEIQGHAPEFFQDEDGDWFISSAERPYRGISVAPVKWVEVTSKK